MSGDHRLAGIGLFSGLSDADLHRLEAEVEEVALHTGEMLFHEGDEGDRAYVIVEGEIEIIKETEGRQSLLAVRGEGDVIGEMALLQEAPRIASARAASPSRLYTIRKAMLDQLLDSSASAARSMFGTLLDRWKETEDQLRHAQRMAQLGTLTAGVAHELNNPAAAAKRAASGLVTVLEELEQAAVRLGRLPLDEVAQQSVAELAETARTTAAAPPRLDALTRSDLEDEVEVKLRAAGIADPVRRAALAVEAGVHGEALERLLAVGEIEEVEAALNLALLVYRAHRIAHEVGEATGRISVIVGSLKTYSYLDQAPVQDVDVIDGIEQTINILSHKLKGIDLVREYAEPVPKITAFGVDLNQVWTNLIDNAIDEVEKVDDPRISIRARAGDGGGVVVEIEDNGPGIPDAIRHRIFDAFFTTKGPGKGTGLGLSTCYRIVVLEHRGRLTVESEPGRTVFVTELPADPTRPR